MRSSSSRCDLAHQQVEVASDNRNGRRRVVDAGRRGVLSSTVRDRPLMPGQQHLPAWLREGPLQAMRRCRRHGVGMPRPEAKDASTRDCRESPEVRVHSSHTRRPAHRRAMGRRRPSGGVTRPGMPPTRTGPRPAPPVVSRSSSGGEAGGESASKVPRQSVKNERASRNMNDLQSVCTKRGTQRGRFSRISSVVSRCTSACTSASSTGATQNTAGTSNRGGVPVSCSRSRGIGPSTSAMTGTR